MTNASTTIRPVTKADASVWEAMRSALWPDESGEHHVTVQQYFAGTIPYIEEVLLAIADTGEAVGFAELSIRNIVDGCESGRVAYIEGWFVKPEARGTGIGGALVKAAEEWGRNRGCTEFASDVEIENEASARLHRELGFEETSRVICFRKDL
ncbi:MAG TPA: aminoglycoside 6'-N-acetyltransferase [Candidatus Kapabacteria bacterium]|jgi:aminoglycoside 6'-N-acetyltransferase I|nr:aminoglycoside 6'-N-acetyltransferase [Candidatus Kapabacteria bacterium]